MAGTKKSIHRQSGTGSMSEVRPGVWQLSVSAHGKRHYATVRGDAIDARMALGELCSRVAAVVPEAHDMDLETFVGRVWLPALERRGRANATIRGYRQVMRNHVFPRFGATPISEIADRDVREWVWEVNGAANARKAFTALRACLRFAYDSEYLDRKPLDRRVDLPRQQPQVKRLWDADQAALACRLLRGWHLEPVALVMLGGGLRREEAFGLAASDVEFRRTASGLRAYVAVRRAYTPDDGMKDLKTGGSARVAVVPDPLASRLQEVMPPGHLAARADGSLMDPNAASKMWSALFAPGARLDVLPRITLNQLRHVHETLMVAGGVSPALASKLHGHSQAVEYGHYLGVSDAATEQAASVVGEALLGLHVIGA